MQPINLKIGRGINYFKEIFEELKQGGEESGPGNKPRIN
jgi:hypothetical protein